MGFPAALFLVLALLLGACSGPGGNHPPQIAAFQASPTEGEAPLTVRFTWTVQDPDGDALRCVLKPGDGVTLVLDPCGTSYTYTYTNPNDYTALLQVSDRKGATAQKSALVRVRAKKDFTISLNPTSLRVQQGGSGTTRLTITPQNGFTGTVSLSLAAGRDPVPQGLSLSPQSVQVSGANPVNQTLTVSASSSTPTGTHRLKVRGTSGSLVKEVDLTLTVTAPLRATLDWTPLFLLALGYLLLFLFARTYLIACPSRALARAQLEGLWAEHVEGWEEGRKQEDDQKKRDAREDTKECLQKARDLLGGRGFLGRVGALLSLLLWNGKREMAAWALMHRAERRAAALMSDEEVRARLVRGLGELGVFPEEERALW